MMTIKKEHSVHDTILASFNCKSVKRSIEHIRSLCKTSHIIALQETWLLPFELSFLSTIDDSFGSTGSSAVDISTGMLKGRPYGGVALLWNKSVFNCVSIVPCDNPRIAAIKIVLSDKPVLIISIYT